MNEWEKKEAKDECDVCIWPNLREKKSSKYSSSSMHSIICFLSSLRGKHVYFFFGAMFWMY